MNTLLKTFIVFTALISSFFISAQTQTSKKQNAIELTLIEGKTTTEKSYANFKEVFKDKQLIKLGLNELLKYENNKLIVIPYEDDEKITISGLATKSNSSDNNPTVMTLVSKTKADTVFKFKIY